MASYLVEENISSSYNGAIAKQSVHRGADSDCISDTWDGTYPVKIPAMRYDPRNPDFVKKYIRDVMKIYGNVNTFNGLEALKQAEAQGLLRQGQLIFGTVSIAHHEDLEGTFWGRLYNVATPLITWVTTGQMRKYAYLHSCIYAGIYEGGHYVIENGGYDPDLSNGMGTICPSLLEAAFEVNSSFFVVTPPRDSKGNSTRYLVLQRALASIGLQYKYSIRSVSCETFTMALLGTLDHKRFAPLQLEVIRSHKRQHPNIDQQRDKDIRKFKKFYGDLCEQIKKVPEGTILSLKFYMNVRDNQRFKSTFDHPTDPWFFRMKRAYTQYLQAAKSGNTQKCQELLDMGLNPEGRSQTTRGTAIMVAIRKRHWHTVKLLIQREADGGAALIQASSKGDIDTCLALIDAGVDPEATSPNYNGTAVQEAARAGKWKTCLKLVEAGADGGKALFYAALEGHTQTCRDLMRMHTNLKDIVTAVRTAASAGHGETLIALVEEGADGGEALKYAASKGYTQICLDLLKLGVHSEGRYIYPSCNGTAVEEAALAGKWDTALTLVEKGANGGEVFFYAASNGYTQLCVKLQKLLKLDLNLHIMSQSYIGTPVEVAAREGHWETVSALVNEGADRGELQQLLNDGLINAAQSGHIETITSVVSLGAQLEYQDTQSGYTALTWAKRNRQTEAIEALRSMGGELEPEGASCQSSILQVNNEFYMVVQLNLGQGGTEVHDRVTELFDTVDTVPKFLP